MAHVATVLGPRRPDATSCALRGPAQRAGYVRDLTRRPVALGVLAYSGGEVGG